MSDKSTNSPFDTLKGKKEIKILFVCLGNICRSPAAEGVVRAAAERRGVAHRFVFDSAGMGSWHVGQLPDRRMRDHARRRGYDLTHRARQVSAYDFDDFDIIVGMDDSNIADLRAVAPSPEAERKIVPMRRWLDPAMRYDHVPDPYYEGAEGFELVLDLLENAADRMLDELLS